MRNSTSSFMLMARRVGAVIVGVIGLLSIMATSGGGGGDDDDPPFSNSSLSGTYVLVGYGHDLESDWGGATYTAGAAMPEPNGFYSSMAEITFDGAGGYSVDFVENEDGTASAGMESGTYSVAPDGTVTIDGDTIGNIISDTATLVFGQITEGEDPEIMVLVRKDGTGLDEASLTGEYFFTTYAYETGMTQDNAPSSDGTNRIPTPNGFFAANGTMTFNGLGGYTLTEVLENQDGVIAADTDLGTYTVTPEGNVVLDEGYDGVMRGDGEILIFSAIRNGDDPEVTVAIRKGAGTFDNASLNGNFIYAYYAFDADPDDQPLAPENGQPVPLPVGFSSETGIISFDGSGNATGSTTLNIDGSTETETFPEDGETFTYSVMPDGTILLDGEQRGQMSSDGSIIVFSSMEDGEPPGIFVAVRL